MTITGQPRSLELSLPDGSTTTVLLFDPAHTSSAPLVVIWPGFGIGGRYYQPMASFLADHGFPVAIGELRGQGTNTAVPTRSHQWGYHEMVTQDYPLTIRVAKGACGLGDDHPVVLLTHSMGGQIGVLFLSNPVARELNVVGMMGVGTGSPYRNAFRGRDKLKLTVGAPMMGAVSAVLGYWPGGRIDLAGYGRQAGRHVREWAQLSRTNEFTHLAGADYENVLPGIRTPVLLTRFSNDGDCTIASAQALAQHFPDADPVVEEIPGDLGHNRWAREPEIVGRRFIRFYEEVLA